ncbi:hypothetical protein GCM10010182_00720 [Actinomadura cremea]|nr:hypothetical protein GCM10010182_00720 [Actinomadura cremea]
MCLGAALAGALEVLVERRRVFDIAPIEVTKLQLAKRRCGHGSVTSVKAPAQ